ncbi:MAG: hypothetical protein QM608_21215 [Caulobacter sp.]
MRGAKTALVGGLAGLVLASGAGAATPRPEPETFVRQAFAAAGEPAADQRAYLALFAPELRGLIQQDRRDGEVGALDYEPICHCQDDDGLVLGALTVSGDARAPVVEAEIVVPTAPPTIDRVVYSLAWVDGRWRIADIRVAGRPSLKAWLARASR